MWNIFPLCLFLGKLVITIAVFAIFLGFLFHNLAGIKKLLVDLLKRRKRRFRLSELLDVALFALAVALLIAPYETFLPAVIEGMRSNILAHYVGYIVGFLVGLVLPKVFRKEEELDITSSRKALINMLGTSKVFERQIFKDINMEKENDLLEIFIHIVAKKLKEELMKGLYREYNIKEGPLNRLKGRLLFKKNTLYLWDPYLYCRYNIFTRNNDTNRYLRYGVEELLRTTKETKNKELLSFCLEYLQDINPNSTYNFKHHRLVERWETLISYVMSLIQPKSGITWGGMKHRFPAFCWDMEKLFERFVAETLKECNEDWVVWEQKVEKLFKDRGGDIRPDIILKTGDGKYIIDVKYKEPLDMGKEQRSFSDIYQVFTYYKVLENECKKDIFLIYPTIKESVHVYDSLTLNVKEEVEVCLVKFPIDKKPSEVKEEVVELFSG